MTKKILELIKKYPIHNIGYNILQTEVSKIENNETPYSTYTGSMILMKEIILNIQDMIDKDDFEKTIDYCKNILKKELNSIFENRVMIAETVEVRKKIIEICGFLLDDLQSMNINEK